MTHSAADDRARGAPEACRKCVHVTAWQYAGIVRYDCQKQVVMHECGYHRPLNAGREVMFVKPVLKG